MRSTGAAKGPSEGSPRFPALDPEPGHRPWARSLVPWIVLAAVGGLVAGVVEGVSGSSRPGHPAAPAGPLVSAHGRIVAESEAAQLAVSDVRGGHVVAKPALGQFGRATVIAASLDGRLLSTGAGGVIALRAGALEPVHSAVHLTSGEVLPNFAMFADGDKALVVQGLNRSYGGGPPNTAVSVVTLAAGQSTGFGTADVAAGDPQQLGVFVSVAAPSSAALQPGESPPDADVELRDAGRPAVLLGSAASFSKLLDMDPAEPVTLTPLPDPAGDKVAVVVATAIPPSPSAAVGGSPAGGIVLVDRTGRVLTSEDAVPPGFATWSADGSRLAFLTSPVGRGEVTVWTLGKGVRTRALADPYSSGGSCLWSPDSRWILCSVQDSNFGGAVWNVARANGGPFYLVHPTPGLALAWIPAATSPVATPPPPAAATLPPVAGGIR